MVFAVRDLCDAASGHYAVGRFFSDRRIVALELEIVVFFDEQPVWLFLVGVLAAHPDERPLAVPLRAMQEELERAVAQTCIDVRVGSLRLPCDFVPEHDGAAAVLALGDDALEA